MVPATHRGYVHVCYPMTYTGVRQLYLRTPFPLQITEMAMLVIIDRSEAPLVGNAAVL